MNLLRSAAEVRVLPGPLGSVHDPAGQLCNRSVRSIQAAVAVLALPSAHIDGGCRIQHSPRICLGIPITSRQEERHDATTRTRAPSARIIHPPIPRRTWSLCRRRPATSRQLFGPGPCVAGAGMPHRSFPKAVESGGEARLSRGEGLAVSGGFRHIAGASGSTLTTFPLPAHRTQRADFPHWALAPDHALAHAKLRLPAFLPQSCGWCPASARLPGLRLQLPTQPRARPLCRPRPCLPTVATRRPGARFASACDVVRSFRTEIGAHRLAPILIVPASFPNQGPFPPPALPGLPGTTSLSATLSAQTGPHEFPVGACTPPTGIPVLHPSPCAHIVSPLARRRRPVLRSPNPLAFPVAGSLPRNVGGSASA